MPEIQQIQHIALSAAEIQKDEWYKLIPKTPMHPASNHCKFYKETVKCAMTSTFYSITKRKMRD